uniref:AraC family transcriptional regulator n=1 Tax=Vitiosangium cumulatum TaxID=1867796 RepID=A0A7D4XGM4_9BACT|nr:AraC family transcriptional regulator [Vitiosangium cumulatum]
MSGLSRTKVIHSGAGQSRWELASRPIPPCLRPYVRGWLGYREATPGGGLSRELPAPRVVVIFEFGPPIQVFESGSEVQSSRYTGGFVAGLHEQFALTRHDGFQAGLQLDLTPIGARLLFGLPMSELTEQVFSLADLLPLEHRRICERLASLSSWDARFDLVERLLQERLAAPATSTALMAWASRRIEASGGAIDIRQLARELGYSSKHLITLFRNHVGVAPKFYASLVRFDRLVQHLKSGRAGRWADLALELGYSDQAHLAREVRRFSGTTLTELRALGAEAPSLPPDR